MDFASTKKTLAIALCLAVLGGGYYFYQQKQQPDDLKLYGNVDVRQVSLAFNSSERIATLNVDEGATVKKGQVLGTLRSEPLKLAIAQSKAQIAAQNALVNELHNGSRPQEIVRAEATTRSAAADYDNALVYQQRMQSLYNQSAISKQMLDDANARLKAAKGALDNAQAAYEMVSIGPREEEILRAEGQLQALQANLALQEYNLEQTQLVAPVDGVVRSRLLEAGDMAAPSKPVFLVTTNDKKWVRAYISEKHLGEIKPGMQAKITIDSFPDKPLTGEVGYISDTAEFTPKTVQTEELRTSLLYEVRIYVDDKDNVLRMGMPATVTFD